MGRWWLRGGGGGVGGGGGEGGGVDGARLGCGGHRGPGEGQVFLPTLLIDCNHDCTVMKEEIFGPVLQVVRADSLEEAAHLPAVGLDAIQRDVRVRECERLAEVLPRQAAAGPGDGSCERSPVLSVPLPPLRGQGALHGALHGGEDQARGQNRRGEGHRIDQDPGDGFRNILKYKPRPPIPEGSQELTFEFQETLLFGYRSS